MLRELLDCKRLLERPRGLTASVSRNKKAPEEGAFCFSRVPDRSVRVARALVGLQHAEGLRRAVAAIRDRAIDAEAAAQQLAHGRSAARHAVGRTEQSSSARSSSASSMI